MQKTWGNTKENEGPGPIMLCAKEKKMMLRIQFVVFCLFHTTLSYVRL